MPSVGSKRAAKRVPDLESQQTMHEIAALRPLSGQFSGPFHGAEPPKLVISPRRPRAASAAGP